MPKVEGARAAAQQGTNQDDDLFSKFDEAWRTLGPGVQQLLSKARATGAAADSLGCSCAKCLRKAGPVREDAEERILHITHVLADVYEETPNPEDHIKQHHRTRARQFMAAVEANDVQRLESYFLECNEEHRGEIVGELIISAAQAGHVDTIRCLAKYATDDDYLDMSDSAKGARPLMFAAHNGHVAAVRLLLELGADPNATDDHGYNALTISTFCDRAGVAEALCQHKETIVDQVDERERTALCYAALYGSDNCVHVLAAHGADVFHQDDEQADPLDLAEQSGRASTAEALRKLQLKARMAMRRAERKADAAERAAGGVLDEEERARRAAEAEAKAAELLAECMREESAKKAAELERQQKLKKQKQEASVKKQARVKGQNTLGPASHGRTGSMSSSEGGQAHPTSKDHDTNANHHTAPGHAPTKQSGGVKGSTKAGVAVAHANGNGLHSTKPPFPPVSVAAVVPPPAAPPAVMPASLELPPLDASEPVLRRAWEVLLEEAKDCREPHQQTLYLQAVKTLLPRAADAGISVKYGRKILQRLEVVAPARIALQEALESKDRHAEVLEAALKLARPAASLLDATMLAEAEAALEACRAVDESYRLQQEQQAILEQLHLEQEEALLEQQRLLDQAAQRQQQQQQQQQQAAHQPQLVRVVRTRPAPPGHSVQPHAPKQHMPPTQPHHPTMHAPVHQPPPPPLHVQPHHPHQPQHPPPPPPPPERPSQTASVATRASIHDKPAPPALSSGSAPASLPATARTHVPHISSTPAATEPPAHPGQPTAQHPPQRVSYTGPPNAAAPRPGGTAPSSGVPHPPPQAPTHTPAQAAPAQAPQQPATQAVPTVPVQPPQPPQPHPHAPPQGYNLGAYSAPAGQLMTGPMHQMHPHPLMSLSAPQHTQHMPPSGPPHQHPHHPHHTLPNSQPPVPVVPTLKTHSYHGPLDPQQTPQPPSATHGQQGPTTNRPSWEFMPTVGSTKGNLSGSLAPPTPLNVMPSANSQQSIGLPSPTAPLSVAAAALGLGNLNLQPFGYRVMGGGGGGIGAGAGSLLMSGSAPSGTGVGSAATGSSGLLGALHNTGGVGGMLGGLPGGAGTGGASRSFNTPWLSVPPETSQVPPDISAAWAKPSTGHQSDQGQGQSSQPTVQAPVQHLSQGANSTSPSPGMQQPSGPASTGSIMSNSHSTPITAASAAMSHHAAANAGAASQHLHTLTLPASLQQQQTSVQQAQQHQHAQQQQQQQHMLRAAMQAGHMGGTQGMHMGTMLGTQGMPASVVASLHGLGIDSMSGPNARQHVQQQLAAAAVGMQHHPHAGMGLNGLLHSQAAHMGALHNAMLAQQQQQQHHHQASPQQQQQQHVLGGRMTAASPSPRPEPSSLCVACQSAPKDSVCLPCMHQVLCMACANRRMASRACCPLCNAPVKQVFDVGAHN